MHYKNYNIEEERICLFDSHTNSVEQIAKFPNYLESCEVATTKDKVGYLFGIANFIILDFCIEFFWRIV